MRLIFLIFISFKLTASDIITLSLADLKGSSNYEVWQHATALKSKLIFPIDATLLHLGYQKQLSSKLSFDLHTQTTVDTIRTKGEDYDWRAKDLTVYSHSNNVLKNYYDIKLNTTYKTDFFHYNIATTYKHLEFTWQKTEQFDYVQNRQITVSGRSITYKQDLLIVTFSPAYHYKVDKFKLFLAPELSYGYNFSKDSHLLRDFYTKTNYHGLGYGYNCNISYSLSSPLSLYFKYHYFNFKDTHAKMNYNTVNGYKYMSLPSSMSYKENRLSFGFQHTIN